MAPRQVDYLGEGGGIGRPFTEGLWNLSGRALSGISIGVADTEPGVFTLGWAYRGISIGVADLDPGVFTLGWAYLGISIGVAEVDPGVFTCWLLAEKTVANENGTAIAPTITITLSVFITIAPLFLLSVEHISIRWMLSFE